MNGDIGVYTKMLKYLVSWRGIYEKFFKKMDITFNIYIDINTIFDIIINIFFWPHHHPYYLFNIYQTFYILFQYFGFISGFVDTNIIFILFNKKSLNEIKSFIV